jgi:hypothetical protein
VEEISRYIDEAPACSYVIVARFGTTADVVDDAYLTSTFERERLKVAIRRLRATHRTTNFDEAAKLIEWVGFKLESAYESAPLSLSVKVLSDDEPSPDPDKRAFSLRSFIEQRLAWARLSVLEVTLTASGPAPAPIAGAPAEKYVVISTPVSALAELLRQTSAPAPVATATPAAAGPGAPPSPSGGSPQTAAAAPVQPASARPSPSPSRPAAAPTPAAGRSAAAVSRPGATGPASPGGSRGRASAPVARSTGTAGLPAWAIAAVIVAAAAIVTVVVVARRRRRIDPLGGDAIDGSTPGEAGSLVPEAVSLTDREIPAPGEAGPARTLEAGRRVAVTVDAPMTVGTDADACAVVVPPVEGVESGELFTVTPRADGGFAVRAVAGATVDGTPVSPRGEAAVGPGRSFRVRIGRREWTLAPAAERVAADDLFARIHARRAAAQPAQP